MSKVFENNKYTGTFFLYLMLLLITTLLSSCGVLTVGQVSSIEQDAIYTQAASTLYAEATHSAGATAVALLTEMAQVQPTETLPSSPTATPPPTETLQPTATPTSAPPTQTSLPPTPTITPMPCDWVQFISDVTVKDGTTFQPDEKFTKTWRLKNIGTCTWTTGYYLVYSSGTTMDGPAQVRLPEDVSPGETIDLSVNLIAPSRDGSFTGKWMLRNADGDWFGLGPKANQEFWVRVNVKKDAKVYVDFSQDYCKADWRSDTISGMACPSLPGQDANPPNGALTHEGEPKLESGGTDDERAIITIPNDGPNGMIRGSFPAVRINSGDHFKTVVGCLFNRWSCSVTFNLSYRADDGPVRDLGSWTQTYDGEISKIDIDLSSLAGKDVEFILTVYSNGSNVDDWAFWLLPRIMR